MISRRANVTRLPEVTRNGSCICNSVHEILLYHFIVERRDEEGQITICEVKNNFCSLPICCAPIEPTSRKMNYCLIIVTIV